MTAIDMHPALPLFIAAIGAAVLPRALCLGLLLAAPVLGGLNLLLIDPAFSQSLTVLGFEVALVRIDRLSLLFGYLFYIAAFIATVYSLHLRDRVQQVAGCAYAGAAIGAVFAADLIALFLFWELMAVTSVMLVLARRRDRALRAAVRYLVWQVGSGVLLLAGAAFYIQATGVTAFDQIDMTASGAWLILAAFGIKAAFPFAHNWLTDAYPEATATGAVFLSAFTTKVAVYALARGFPGLDLLIYIGVAMTCFPIFFAVIENDLRRVLAYSMVNQVGFMVCGIGIGTELALNGAVAHAFNDVIFKGLLMMSMGAVLHMTGRINGSDLGGLYKSMPLTTTFCIIGAASISAFPLFSGFVSKSMVMAAALENGFDWVWLGLLFASAGVFHHAGIKIPFFAFFAHDSGLRPGEPPPNMLAAMAVAALLCVGIGSYPTALYALLPWPVDYAPFTYDHVIAQMQLLFFSALAFVWLKRNGYYPPELRSVVLDADCLYRALLPRIAAVCGPVVAAGGALLNRFGASLAGRTRRALAISYGPRGLAERDWTGAAMVLVSVAVLGGYLLVYWWSG